MDVVLQIAEGWLDLNAGDVGLAERRAVTTADQERCNAWATQYRRLLGREGAVGYVKGAPEVLFERAAV